MITFRQLTRRVAQLEGKKRQVDIAQITEVTSKILRILASEYRRDPYGFSAWLGRFQRRRKT